MADIFVSYTSSDRDWAFWIAKELEKAGHTPHIHEWEVSAGGDIAASMEERHDKADHILCVVSPIYLAKPHSSWERRAAQWAAQADRPYFALPVFVEDCKAPTLLAPFKRCDLYDLDEEAARARLVDFLRPASKPTGPVPFPGRSKPQSGVASSHSGFPITKRLTAIGRRALSNIPIAVPLYFLGRDRELNDIKSALTHGEGRVAISAVHGMRGVGKTTLAAAFAERNRMGYRVTWWIRAQTDATMRADLVALGVRLGWTTADDKEQPALGAILERLSHEGDGILLIYDNAVDIVSVNGCLPRGGSAHIIVTSNAPNWRGIAAPIAIEVWPMETGADYLTAATGRNGERDTALALSNVLGGLPLAHEQAAAYCDRLGVSLGEYRKRFEIAAGKLLADTRDVARDYGLTVAKAFALAIDEAAKVHPAAAPLIEYVALLAPEPIPLFLFGEARKKFGEPFASALAGDGLDEAVGALRAFALIDRESIADEREPAITTDCIRLHRLVREVAATRREGKAREDARRALVEAMEEVCPTDTFNNPSTWPRVRRLDAIAVVLLTPESTLPNGVEPEASLIFNRLASYRQSALGAYSEAKTLFERSLAIREKVSGPEHGATALSMNDLALSLKEQGDFAAARPLYERALLIFERANGPEHLNTAMCLNNLAGLLRAQEDLAAARPLYERALAIHEKVSGPEHPYTATALNNFALLLVDQGDLAKARLLFERALAIHEKVSGPEHPQTALGLHNLADLLCKQSDLAAARTLYERALAIHEKVTPEHPITAQSLNNLAGLLRTQGDFVAASPLLERALTIVEKAFGPKHSSTKTVARNAAFVLDSLGRASDAKALREKFEIA